MNVRYYKPLIAVVLLLTLIWVGWSMFAWRFVERTPGDANYQAGNSFFEDELYAQALNKYQFALDDNPNHINALRGKACSLMQLGELPEALRVFNDVIAREPEFAASYAKRGIVLDRLEYYKEAVADYEKALSFGTQMSEGPDWMTHPLENQAGVIPDIADRAAYLKAQLQLPPQERLISQPVQHELQQPYKK